MATRKYEQVLRAEGAEETRRRILDAVGACLRADPTQQPSLGKVAEAAQVSRTTIYADFSSRAGLFDAFVVDLWERTGLPELTRAAAVTGARDRLRASLDAASRMKAKELAVYRVLHAMDRLDPESAGGAVQHMEADRRAGVEDLARHLEREGVLRAGVTRARAIDALWVLTSFESLDLLLSGRKLRIGQAVEVLVEMAEAAVCDFD